LAANEHLAAIRESAIEPVTVTHGKGRNLGRRGSYMSAVVTDALPRPYLADINDACLPREHRPQRKFSNWGTRACGGDKGQRVAIQGNARTNQCSLRVPILNQAAPALSMSNDGRTVGKMQAGRSQSCSRELLERMLITRDLIFHVGGIDYFCRSQMRVQTFNTNCFGWSGSFEQQGQPVRLHALAGHSGVHLNVYRNGTLAVLLRCGIQLRNLLWAPDSRSEIVLDRNFSFASPNAAHQ